MVYDIYGKENITIYGTTQLLFYQLKWVLKERKQKVFLLHYYSTKYYALADMKRQNINIYIE